MFLDSGQARLLAIFVGATVGTLAIISLLVSFLGEADKLMVGVAHTHQRFGGFVVLCFVFPHSVAMFF